MGWNLPRDQRTGTRRLSQTALLGAIGTEGVLEALVGEGTFLLLPPDEGEETPWLSSHLFSGGGLPRGTARLPQDHTFWAPEPGRPFSQQLQQ